MAYQKQTWVDGVTPLNAEHLNHMEQGISQLSSGGSGLTDDEKTLMLSLFDNAVFNDIDMSATLNQLKNLFNGGEPITYSITYNLTDVTSDNPAEVAKEAFPFTTTLTAADGLSIREDSLSIVMGGEDITDFVYVDGVISISVVTGEIVITAEAKDPTFLYGLGETVFDGSAYIDTGVSLFDGNKPFSILVYYTSQQTYTNVFSESTPENLYEPYKNGYCLYGRGNSWSVGVSSAIYTSQFIDVANNKVVITYDNTAKKHTVYFLASDGTLTVKENTSWNMSSLVGKTSGLRLGTGNSHNKSGFKGTIHQFEVYSKVVDEAKINTFMGVN